MVNIYSELINLEELFLEESLRKIAVFEIFRPVVRSFPNSQARKIIQYIAQAYSKDSTMVALEVAWAQNKKTIANHVGLLQDLHEAVLEVKNLAVLISINLYLDHQGMRLFSHLQMKKDLYEQMVSAAIQGNDWDQKRKCSEHADKLLAEIENVENQYKGLFEKLKAGVDEARSKFGKSLAVELL